MSRSPSHNHRSLGYVLSVISVLLLAVVTWPHASGAWWSSAALVGGVLTSIVGIWLRAAAHARDARELADVERKVNGD